MPNTGRPQSWNKIKLLQEEIKKGENEFIMWIDADAFFYKDAKKISCMNWIVIMRYFWLTTIVAYIRVQNSKIPY